jgi:hypothetical protein
MSQDDRIDEGFECPDCGENLLDNLAILEDDTYICESCCCHYDPDTGLPVVGGAYLPTEEELAKTDAALADFLPPDDTDNDDEDEDDEDEDDEEMTDYELRKESM